MITYIVSARDGDRPVVMARIVGVGMVRWINGSE